MSVLPLQRDDESGPFLDAAADGVLVLRRCPEGHWSPPTAQLCLTCGHPRPEWTPAAGTGHLVSWAVVRRRDGSVDVVAALVELAEGPWLRGPLRAEPEVARTGLPVVVAFERAEGGEPVPVFRLAADV